MKTGLILLVPEQGPELDEQRANAPVLDLAPDELRLATSEVEVAYGWWEMLARGAGRVHAAHARWDEGRKGWAPTTPPVHVHG